MTIIQHSRAVGVFPTYRQVEMALRDLQALDFPMGQVSVMARDRDDVRQHETEQKRIATDRASASNKLEETAAAGSLTGGALGSLAGLLLGLGAIAIPGFGTIAIGGAVATALAGLLSGGVIGAAAGGLLGGLIGLGIPEEQARVYHDRLHRGEYLILVEGMPNEIERVREVLHRHGLQEWGIYAAPVGSQP